MAPESTSCTPPPTVVASNAVPPLDIISISVRDTLLKPLRMPQPETVVLTAVAPEAICSVPPL
jgi:hypothetical protein